nr:hybrid sensor histidine kinase/response regulator [uncultured Cohaesibacter sp.]
MTRNSQHNDTKKQKSDSFRHDLRTHLSAIVSLTDLIRKSSDPEKTASLIEALHFAAGNAMAIVEGGAEIFKQPQQDTILLSCWLREFESMAAILANANEAQFKLHISSGLEAAAPMAPAPGYLHRVLMLLLDNALKYAHGATITLTASLKSETVMMLTLCDDGPGFGDEDPEFLFEPYHRGQGQRTTDGKGLGLWSARHILSVLGGTIEASRNPPHGACFHICLPIEEAETGQATSAGQAAESEQSSHKPQADHQPEILIVDDNRTNLLILTEILKALGYQPVAAQSGEEALRLVEDISPVLAILDIRMEDMDGWELIGRLQQNAQFTDLPVMAMSADDAPRIIAPFRAWLRRPINPETLYHLIQSCLEERQGAAG